MAQLHYGDQEARRQAEDVDHDDVNKLHGSEGYGVQVLHPKRNDLLTADRESPVDVSAGYGDVEAKPEDAGKAFSASGLKQEDAVKRQLNQVIQSIDEGYTTLGIDQESQDDSNSENSERVPSEEGNNMKDREGIAPYESMAKKVEDHSATEGGIIDVHSLKKDYVDLSDGGNLREREGTAPDGSLGNLEEQEEREGVIPQGSYTDEQAERECASKAKQLGGIIDVQSLKEDFLDLSEGNIESDPIQATQAETSQITKSLTDDPKQRYSVDDPKQESPIDDSSNKQEDFAEQESPIDDAIKQDLAKAYPNDDDIHGCESFQGDDGREKIKSGGYNIDSGEPENVVYDAAEVLGDRYTHENEADAAIKPSDDLSAQEESSPDEHEGPFTEHVSSAVQQDTRFIVDSKVDGKEDAIKRENGENGPANAVSPYSESVHTDLSFAAEQGVGLKMDREEDVKERENIENVPANEESPYAKFNRTDDYVKAGYGGEGFVAKRNEDVDKELREPPEKVGLEEERRPTHEHALDNKLHPELDKEMTSSREYGYGTKLAGNSKKSDESIEVPKRPPSLPHPQPEDLAEETFNKKNNSNEDDEQQNQKKGVFGKIKEKLTPHFTSG